MTQAINSNPVANGYGTINRIGSTQDGRNVYQITDPTGKESVKLSVAQQDSDKFEKSYNEIMEAAPKLQKFAQTTTPEKMQKRQSAGKWIIGICTAIGGGIPLIKAKCGGKTWKQALVTLAGTIAGFICGTIISVKTTTPPGTIQLTNATKTLSKLDIKPYNG